MLPPPPSLGEKERRASRSFSPPLYSFHYLFVSFPLLAFVCVLISCVTGAELFRLYFSWRGVGERERDNALFDQKNWRENFEDTRKFQKKG